MYTDIQKMSKHFLHVCTICYGCVGHTNTLCILCVDVEFLLNLFDPLVAKLQALATQGPVAAGGGNQTEIQVVEGELAWLVYIIGAVVGARGTSRTSEEHEQLDGDLCARVFQTIRWVEMRQPEQVLIYVCIYSNLKIDDIYGFWSVASRISEKNKSICYAKTWVRCIKFRVFGNVPVC